MIKKLLKYGTIAGASFVAGAYVQMKVVGQPPKQNSSETNKDKIWEGETGELKMPVVMANDKVERLNEVINTSNYSNALFVESDLRDVRRKLMHAISDAKEEDAEFLTIEISDRKRLRFIEEAFLADKARAFKPDEY